MMSDSASPKIIIVGASVAGLTLALSLLHHANPSSPNAFYTPTDIQILESRTPDAKAGGAIVLAPNALRILDRLGLYAKLRSRGYEESYNVFRNSEGEKVGEYPFGGKEAFGYDALRIARPAVLDVLRAEWMSKGGKIQFEVSLRAIIGEDDSGVLIRVRRGGTDDCIIEELRAGILVGADGVHSKTRTFVLGHEVQPVYGGTVVIGAKASFLRVRFGPGFEECVTNDERCLALATEKGTILMVASDPAGEDVLWIRQFPAEARTRQGWEAFEADKPKLAEMMTQDQGTGVLPEVVESLIQQIKPEECYIWAVHTLLALSRWISPNNRAVIIGDAAHTVIPAAGQGAGQAMENAFSLASVLVSKATSEELRVWQYRRMRKVERVAQLGLQLLNIRLPPAERAKLPADQVFDLSGSRDEMNERLEWLYGDDSADGSKA